MAVGDARRVGDPPLRPENARVDLAQQRDELAERRPRGRLDERAQSTAFRSFQRIGARLMPPTNDERTRSAGPGALERLEPLADLLVHGAQLEPRQVRAQAHVLAAAEADVVVRRSRSIRKPNGSSKMSSSRLPDA